MYHSLKFDFVVYLCVVVQATITEEEEHYRWAAARHTL